MRGFGIIQPSILRPKVRHGDEPQRILTAEYVHERICRILAAIEQPVVIVGEDLRDALAWGHRAALSRRAFLANPGR